jgi:soluble lytic murein transglycosylase-like protein
MRWRWVLITTGFWLLTLLLAVGLGAVIATRDDAPSFPSPKTATWTPLSWELPPRWDYFCWTARYAEEQGVPLSLALRLLAWESGWHNTVGALNEDGTRDYGLARLNGYWLGVGSFTRYNDWHTVDPMDPETAIRVGIRYLAALYAQSGNWAEAVRRYAGNRPRAHTAKIMGGAP